MDQATESIIIKGNVENIYNMWADFENFPQFMKPVKSVRRKGESLSHWEVDGPFGTTIEWDAITTRMDKNQRIAWNSTDNGDIKTSGQVTFTKLPADETQVTVTMKYMPKPGLAISIFDSLFGHLDERLVQNLRDFKSFAEKEIRRHG